ncbi:MAG: hypothetical protein ABH875_00705 [Candidatus Omnitrophota bacterium]
MLRDIINKIKTLEIHEERSIADEYCEVVFKNCDVAKWTGMLAELLGQPVKPVGKKPTPEDLKATKDFSGIYVNQTLYKKEIGGVTVIAMLWPWGNGELTTLKLAVLQ